MSSCSIRICASTASCRVRSTTVRRWPVITVNLFVLILSQTTTALIHESIPYEVFKGIHGIGGFLMAVIVLVHLWANWTWVVNTLFKRRK